MSEQPHVPWGERIVRIERPPLRFGECITFAIKPEDGSQYWVAKVLESGQLVYEPVSFGVTPQPTLYIDELERRALVKELTDYMEQWFPEDAHANHLKDTIAIRDQLMELVRAGQERHHNLAMLALNGDLPTRGR